MTKSSNFKNFLFLSIFAWQVLPRGLGLYFFGHKVNLPHLLAIALFLLWMLKKFIRKETIVLYKNKVTALIIFLIGLQSLSIFVSKNINASFVVWCINLFTCYLVFFVVSDQVNSIAECKKILVKH